MVHKLYAGFHGGHGMPLAARRRIWSDGVASNMVAGTGKQAGEFWFI
jgi:hypothetical protein